MTTNTTPIHLAAPGADGITYCGEAIEEVSACITSRATYQQYTLPNLEGCRHCWRDSGIIILPMDSLIPMSVCIQTVEDLQRAYRLAYNERVSLDDLAHYYANRSAELLAEAIAESYPEAIRTPRTMAIRQTMLRLSLYMSNVDHAATYNRCGTDNHHGIYCTRPHGHMDDCVPLRVTA